jgi:phenylacetate-CoA ligase
MGDYEVLRQRHLADAQALGPIMIERLEWSEDRLAEFRLGELRRLVRVAKELSPWHRKRLVDVEPLDVAETTLDQLPVMTKTDLMEHFDEIVTDDRLRLDIVEDHLDALTSDAYLFDRYHAAATGGSSGQRALVVFDWDAWATWYWTFARHHVRALRLDPTLASCPQASAGVMAEHPTHISSALPLTFASPESAVRHLFPVTMPTAEIVAGLNGVCPTTLTGYPSALRVLVDEVSAGRLRIRPRRVLSGGEPLLPELRHALEEAWGVPVINFYGVSELGVVGMSCGAGPWLHLHEDTVIVEPVDSSGKAVAPGARSAKLYGTNLFNHALPLLRYEINDEVTLLDRRCACGASGRLIEDPQGRLDDVFVYHGLVVNPHVFRSVIGRRRQIVEYQVRQTPHGADVVVRANAPVDLGQIGQELIVALGRIGLENARVTVATTNAVDRGAAGKLRRFVPLPGRS